MKNAYLIVTDLHMFYKNLRNRVDYGGEISFAWDKIMEIVAKYEKNYCVTVLFLGDLFHRGYQDTFSAIVGNNMFQHLHKRVNGVYTVLGNHEVSYYKDNPFYTLVKTIDSERVRSARLKVCKPVGLQNTVNVVDELSDGEVTFYFNHYGTGIAAPKDGGVNIGLFHQDIVSRTVIAQAEDTFGTQVYAQETDVEGKGLLRGYNYSFLGHMHQMFGMYGLDDGGILYYLGSLGRTNTVEVNDDFLTRDIPVVLVNDGKFAGIEKNEFRLPGREACVKEDGVQDSKLSYEEQKMLKAARSYVFNGDNPIEELMARLNDNVLATQITKELIKSPVDSIGFQLFGEVDKYGR